MYKYVCIFQFIFDQWHFHWTWLDYRQAQNSPHIGTLQSNQFEMPAFVKYPWISLNVLQNHMKWKYQTKLISPLEYWSDIEFWLRFAMAFFPWIFNCNHFTRNVYWNAIKFHMAIPRNEEFHQRKKKRTREKYSIPTNEHVPNNKVCTDRYLVWAFSFQSKIKMKSSSHNSHSKGINTLYLVVQWYIKTWVNWIFFSLARSMLP